VEEGTPFSLQKFYHAIRHAHSGVSSDLESLKREGDWRREDDGRSREVVVELGAVWAVACGSGLMLMVATASHD
jgi:hypothetical protein